MKEVKSDGFAPACKGTGPACGEGHGCEAGRKA